MKCDMPYPEIFSHNENELIDCLLIESALVNDIRVLHLTCIFLVLFFVQTKAGHELIEMSIAPTNLCENVIHHSFQQVKFRRGNRVDNGG